MRLIKFFLPLGRRWLSAALSLLSDVRASYSRGGPRAAAFEVGLWFGSLCALTLAAPVILKELLELTRETEGLRASWLAGEGPENYIGQRCKSAGIGVGSPTYLAALAWSWTMVRYWDGADDAPPAEGADCADEWDAFMPG